MNEFWAKFVACGGETYRLDTRIYLSAISAPSDSDTCIGAVVGKNPGSAQQSSQSAELQPIALSGDKLLPTVRNIVIRAYNESNTPLPAQSYIQVLNLFYLCNPDLQAAISTLQHTQPQLTCESESLNFPWVWYVWGGHNQNLSPLKSRFSSIQSSNHFYIENPSMNVVELTPTTNASARHTQGLRHDVVVPYLGKLLDFRI